MNERGRSSIYVRGNFVYIIRQSRGDVYIVAGALYAMDVQDMRIFARVAALQNLSAVGVELGLTPGTISKRLQALEDDLGAKLFERNTRSLRITEEGEKLLAYVERILVDIEGARSIVGANAEQPRGKLRVATPIVLGGASILHAICQFMQAHREVELHVDITERPVNLHEEGYDVVIGTSLAHNPGLKRKLLSADPQVIVASSSYLEAHGSPSSPEDLSEHSCLVLGESGQWQFVRDGDASTVRVAGRLRSDSSEVLIFAAAAGLGIARASRARVAQDLGRGDLIEVLGKYEVVSESSICAFYPSTKHMLPKLRVFLDFLGDWFREAPAHAGTSRDVDHPDRDCAGLDGANQVAHARGP